MSPLSARFAQCDRWAEYGSSAQVPATVRYHTAKTLSGPQMLPTGDRAIPYTSFHHLAHHQDRPTRDAYTAPAPVTKIGRQPIAASERSENSH